MNGTNVRNILIVIAAIVVMIAALGFISTLLTSVVPIAITAVIAFILGRTTAKRSVLDLFQSARNRVEQTVAGTAKVVEQATAQAPKAASREPATPTQTKAAPVASAPAPAAAPLKNTELLDEDFEVKTPEQIEAEARRLESEVNQQTKAYDPQAALEERKRRLRGGGS
jgi:predicted lipid-binding transport protein (Tim44 family)